MPSPGSYVALDVFKPTGYVMVALTTTFVLLRAAIQVAQQTKMEIQDWLFYAAYASYVADCSLYFSISSPLLKANNEVMTGEAPPWATMQHDLATMAHSLFTGLVLFYICLWCAKLSLLVLYRKLMVGLANVYIRIWWGILVFCVLSWIGCMVSAIAACSTLFTSGTCGAEWKQELGLYLAFTVDVISDLMILFLPMKLTWNLNMPRPRKYGLRILFGTGLICILFATLRVANVGSRTYGKNSRPDPAWLMLWTTLESSIAVIIACSPAFATLYREVRSSQPRSSSVTHTSAGQDSDGLAERRAAFELALQQMPAVARLPRTDDLGQDDKASREQLVHA
ncbi:hypothetical protein E8E13_011219 [Curvularia kusanoi]|uniref:Rhodopsin domain-containing protein n=1 Tax=Curvularia kusanoi TaxID=90978 RepID=A0A9P4WEK5_CURKU|nr:hypothetical protein E8E13_011219 [Curvularia kusanoi]